MYVYMYVCSGLDRREYWGLSESRALSNSVHHYTHALEHSGAPGSGSGGSEVPIVMPHIGRTSSYTYICMYVCMYICVHIYLCK
jgi:hypothetical protein